VDSLDFTATAETTATKKSRGPSPYAYQIRLACGERGAGVASDAEWLVRGASCESRLISVPTGLGKTAAVVLAWLWNCIVHPDAAHRETWPRRLVYCLPMRTLVEQTRDEVSRWVNNLLAAAADLGLDTAAREQLEWLAEHSPVILMGGEENDPARRDWDLHPERPAILIGTQDMLLSRALNRGYGMARARWPMHFGLLNNDALWVLDETQLMGAGLWTSAQLDWLRQDRFASQRKCATWWLSATLGESFLETLDRVAATTNKLLPPLATPINIPQEEAEELEILKARRPVEFWSPSEVAAHRNYDATLAELAGAVRAAHTPHSLSLVVCNTVRAAQALYKKLQADGVDGVVLLTSRFRPQDRRRHLDELLAFERARKKAVKDNTPLEHTGLICISTQVVEAGVDISARRLWMELAPWPSMLQRLGRLNRDAKLNGDARAFVFEVPPEKIAGKKTTEGPYADDDINAAKKILGALVKKYAAAPEAPIREIFEQLKDNNKDDNSISALIQKSLQPKPEPFPRVFEVHGLFSTEPDAFGGFTDVSQWVRGGDKNADVTVFWREWDVGKQKSNEFVDDLSGPVFQREEGCPVAVYRVRDFVKGGDAAFIWNDKTEKWDNIRTKKIKICPGMVIMLPSGVGGYSKEAGWTGEKSDKLKGLPPPGPFDTDDDDKDKRSTAKKQWVALDKHLAAVDIEAKKIADALALPPAQKNALVRAAALHDIGKSFPQWQDTVTKPRPDETTLWAKAPRFDRRAGMRHEAASALAAWHRYYRDHRADFPALAIYLIAAHHGLVRTVLNSRPAPAKQPNVAGIPSDLPATLPLNGWQLDFTCAQDGTDGEFITDTNGNSVFQPAAPSWTALVADLLGGWESSTSQVPVAGAVPANADEPHSLNPFNLAFLETLLRAADCRVSASETGILVTEEQTQKLSVK
jgi:CRISPR-associated endonuclease/helicase Cas3